MQKLIKQRKISSSKKCVKGEQEFGVKTQCLRNHNSLKRMHNRWSL